MQVTAAEAQVALAAASVVVSIVLVVVTFLYYLETRSHTEEMRESRKAEFKPVIKGTIEPFGATHHRFAFQNTGKGAAHDVVARWRFKHCDEWREWTIPLISPGQRHTFELPFNTNERITTGTGIERHLEGTDGILIFEWECRDALGNCACDSEEIDVLETVQTRKGELLPENEETKMKRELRKISKSAKTIAEQFSQ